jgi:putative ABC transport system substrate-binding protein
MRRRDFIGFVGGAAAWPLAARAQQAERMRRIGVLRGDAETDVVAQRSLRSFRERLGELGWMQGRNITIDYRWAAGEVRLIRDYAGELVGLKPDAILSFAPAATAALQRETRTIPIVFIGVADPVRAGLVANLAAPGGNITGFSNYETTMGGKWLELLKQLAPGVSRTIVILNPTNPSGPGFARAIEAAAPQFAMQITVEPVPDTVDYERVIERFAREPNGGMILLPDIRGNVERERIIALAARYRLPAVYYSRFFATGGGLLAYGPDGAEQYRRSAGYVGRILRGEKPGELPVEGPTNFELVINVKTAKTLGLEVPPTLLALADEVIE